MRTNVQCLPEYQLDAAVVVVVVMVVVVVVRRSWIGGKSNDPLVARSRATKKRGGERKKDKGRIFGWVSFGWSTLNAMTRARDARESAAGTERGRGHRAASLFIGGPAKTRTMNGGARSAFSERRTD